MNTLEIIKQVANTSSSLEKLEILRSNKNVAELKVAFRLALSSNINFYIKQIPKVSTFSANLTLSEAFLGLKKLSDRDITGNAARDYLSTLLSNLSKDDSEVLRLVVGRDLKCGASVSIANKVWPNLIATFGYMRCSLPSSSNISKWNWNDGILVQTKMDGQFSNGIVQNNHTELLTRSGSPFPNDFAADLRNELAIVKKEYGEDFCLNGELLVMDISSKKFLPRKIGNGILNSCLQDGDFDSNLYEIKYVVWDIIPYSYWKDKTEYKRPYGERFHFILSISDKLKHIIPITSTLVHNKSEAIAIYNKLIESGEEGAVAKNPKMSWKDGTSKDQVKMKISAEVDLEIVSFNAGNGKNEKYFGSVECKSSDGKLVVNVSGFSDSDRAKMSQQRESLIGKIMAVESNAIIDSNSKGTYSLFLPRYVELRLDKTVADSYEQIVEIFNNSQESIF